MLVIGLQNVPMR